MEVNTTCGLRGSVCCNEDKGGSIDMILYLITMVWIAIFFVGVKVKRE